MRTSYQRRANMTIPGMGVMPKPTGAVRVVDRRFAAWAYIFGGIRVYLKAGRAVEQLPLSVAATCWLGLKTKAVDFLGFTPTTEAVVESELTFRTSTEAQIELTATTQDSEVEEH